MDDFDIYSDLPDFAWLKEVYEADVEVKKEELPTSENDIRELKEKLLKLEKVHKLVLSHYSSLWKTSKQERKRMDRQIADLRSQLDNFAFKRNHRNAVPPPARKQTTNTSIPPSLFGILVPALHSNQPVVGNLYNHPPPPINPVLETNQNWNKQEEIHDENFVDNLPVPSNVITPENSHSSDESEDDVIKKSHYRSTVYGERLRKKLLEEKRNAMRQKKESLLNEKKVNQEQLKHKNQNELGHASQVNKVHVLEGKEFASIKKETDMRTVKEEKNSRKESEFETQNVKESSIQDQNVTSGKGNKQLKDPKQNELRNVREVNKIEILKEKTAANIEKETGTRIAKEENNSRQQSKIETQNKKEPLKQEEKLRNEKQVESKENKKEDRLRNTRENETDRTRRKEDSRFEKVNDVDKGKRDDDFKFRRDREAHKKIEGEESNVKKERDVERRKREDESRIRRERDLDRRRKEEDIEKAKREEQFERRRRQEEIEKRRKDQDTERRKKEDIDKKRRAEIDSRRKDEEIERRKKVELDKRRKEEEEEKKRKERDLEVLKQKENERRRKEEEQHVMRLKEIEIKRNEKQLEELIKERKRIENEMNTLKDEESEEEKSKLVKDTSRKEQSAIEKSQVNQGMSKENLKDHSKQSQKNQSDDKRNVESKAGQRSCENKNSSSVTSRSQTINGNHRNDRHQDNHTSYDKHKYNDRRSRRDQPDRERESRKSEHRNKSRHRNKSNSSHRSDEGRSNHSPKRIKLQEKDKDCHDRLKNPRADRQCKMKSPKRKRQTKSIEKSPHKSKKRKISQDRDLDCNIKLDKNTILKTNVSANNKLDEANIINSGKMSNNCTKNIIDNAISNKNLPSHVIGTRSDQTENMGNVESSLKENKEKLVAQFSKDLDNIPIKLADPGKTPQVVCKSEDVVKDSNRGQSKLTNTVIDEESKDHANKKKTLIDELFEAQEKPVSTSANLRNAKQADKTLDETALSELEDGEISESDSSMHSKDLHKWTRQGQPADKPIETIQAVEKNKLESKNNKNESTSLQKNDIAQSQTTSEIEESILYKILVQSENENGQEKAKVDSHENVSNKTDLVTLKDYKELEVCNIIANKAADESSQYIGKNQLFVNNTNQSEIIGIKNGNEVVSLGTKTSKTILNSNDRVQSTIEKEQSSKCDQPKDIVAVEKTDSDKSVKCVSNPTVLNILVKRSNKNYLKDSNSEKKIDSNEKLLHFKGTGIHNEKNNMKDTCLKENVSNNLTKKNIGHCLTKTEILNEEASESVAKLDTTSEDNAAKNLENASQTKVPLRNVIVVRRRRRPVQLSDSPPVVVINNVCVKT